MCFISCRFPKKLGNITQNNYDLIRLSVLDLQISGDILPFYFYNTIEDDIVKFFIKIEILIIIILVIIMILMHFLK